MTLIIAMYLMVNITIIGSDYSRVCTLGMKDLPEFYKDHWLIDSGATGHIMPYLEDFSNLAQGKQFASTANGSIIKMHGPCTIILKQDHRSAPPVTLTGAWYVKQPSKLST